MNLFGLLLNGSKVLAAAIHYGRVWGFLSLCCCYCCGGLF